MNTQPGTDRKASAFVDADRYARAAIAILLVTTCASAVALAIILGPALNQIMDTISLVPSSEISTAEPGANLTLRKSVGVSRALDNFPTSPAVDGYRNNWWSAGAFAPQWIEVDLEANYVIAEVRLLPSQSPAGAADPLVRGNQWLTSFRAAT